VFERVANLAEQDRIVLIVSPRELLDRAEQDLLRGMASSS
jgi:purine-binding chemotaxis protein CheW